MHNTTQLPPSKLRITDLRVWVHLGCGDEEKHNAQMIGLDIEFTCPTPPKAITTDDLNDTLCFNMATQCIQAFVEGKRFNMIEFLGQGICDTMCALAAEQKQTSISMVKITLRKLSPPIQGVHGGTGFVCYGAPEHVA